jgi:site-specific DNA-methyltransferase (adenine-specific)
MIELHNIDCMQYLKTLENNAFELAIVDPPYFEEYAKANYTGSDISTTNVKRQTKKINHWEIPNKLYFDELIRVSKNQIIWGINYYAKYTDDVGRIIWDKKNDNSTFSKCEIASHSLGIRVDQFRYTWNGFLQEDMQNKETRIHPTQKPVKLYEWLLMNYAKEGDRILDTHLGSGSIAIACHNLDFDLVGCELDKEYYKAASKRLKQHQAQRTIFQEIKEQEENE